jgi:hypothetical protein
MSAGRAFHLYAGAIIRGRSVRSEVGLGLEGEKGSCGHPFTELEGLNVGDEKAAAFVVDGYIGTINSESVPVGNTPTAFLALNAELAAAGLPGDELLELEL